MVGVNLLPGQDRAACWAVLTCSQDSTRLVELDPVDQKPISTPGSGSGPGTHALRAALAAWCQQDRTKEGLECPGMEEATSLPWAALSLTCFASLLLLLFPPWAAGGAVFAVSKDGRASPAVLEGGSLCRASGGSRGAEGKGPALSPADLPCAYVCAGAHTHHTVHTHQTQTHHPLCSIHTTHVTLYRHITHITHILCVHHPHHTTHTHTSHHITSHHAQ